MDQAQGLRDWMAKLNTVSIEDPVGKFETFEAYRNKIANPSTADLASIHVLVVPVSAKERTE